MDEMFQSTYKANHSTKTAQNDVLCALDGQQSVILLLFDLSETFDILYHAILLERLFKRFFMNGTELKAK